MTERGKRGGAREGAGRKKLGDQARQRALVTLPPALLAAVDKRAADEGVSRSEAIAHCLADWWLAQAVGIEFPPAAVSGVRVGVTPLQPHLREDVNRALSPVKRPEVDTFNDVPELPPDDAGPGWHHASRQFSNYDQDFGNYLVDFLRYPRDPAKLRYFLIRAVEELDLPGHEAGFDHDLAFDQLRGHVHTDKLFSALGRAASATATAAIRTWLDFVAGRVCARSIVPELGYVGGVAWEDVSAHLGGTPEGWLATLDVIEVQIDQTDDGEPVFGPVSKLEYFHFQEVVEAIAQALGGKGLLKGPCLSCGFKAWPVSYRAPGAPGRRPLEWDYCPACRAMRERARQAASKRRSRAAQPPQSTYDDGSNDHRQK